jgi:hypothetical protein
MGREKASINLEIWGDADWRDLTDPAQSLWHKLMEYKIDYCGVGNFHPGRLAAMTREQTPDQVMIAAQELSEKFWVVFDQSTDEFMVRGYLRHDGVLKQPRLAVSAALAYASIASNKIRAVVVFEIARFKRENPDLPAWDKPQMKTLLKQPSTAVTDTVTDLEWSFSTAYGQGSGERLPIGAVAPMTGATTSTSTATTTATSTKEDAPPKSKSYPHGVESPSSETATADRLGVAS